MHVISRNDGLAVCGHVQVRFENVSALCRAGILCNAAAFNITWLRAGVTKPRLASHMRLFDI
jgi:hypothetical protein